MLVKLIAMAQVQMAALKKDIEGATAIEYGLIAGGISLAIVAAVFAFGADLKLLFVAMSEKMADAREDGISAMAE